MQVVGQHHRKAQKELTPKRIARAIMLTYERPGMLTETVRSFRKSAPDIPLTVYDDGSVMPEKLAELEALDCDVVMGEHCGLVRTWMKVFEDFRGVYNDDDGIVLLEDDLEFAPGWDDVLIKMASGVDELGLKPGAMTCFRCHRHPQSQIRDLNGVRGYQSMQHGFQLNMIPAWVLRKESFLEEAVCSSENGEHGIDIWFIGGLSHRLGLTNFMSESSWVAHVGAGKSVAESQGYASFNGVGYNLVNGLNF